MNKFIIIPKKYFTERIEDLKEEALIAQEEKDKETENGILLEISVLIETMHRNKEIDLDKPNIEKRAKEEYVNYCKSYSSEGIVYKHFIDGFKQAFKDLI